jgi:hypothetical protein
MTGLQGAPGPEGPTGPQGPAGVTNLETLFATSPVTTLAAFTSMSTTVACTGGKKALSGGYETLGNGVFMTVTSSHPTSATSWRVNVMNNVYPPQSFNNVQVRVYVNCATVN